MAEMGLVLGTVAFFITAMAVVMGVPLRYFIKRDQELMDK